MSIRAPRTRSAVKRVAENMDSPTEVIYPKGRIKKYKVVSSSDSDDDDELIQLVNPEVGAPTTSTVFPNSVPSTQATMVEDDTLDPNPATQTSDTGTEIINSRESSPVYISTQAKRPISFHSDPGRLQAIKDRFTEAQRADIIKIGFGGLLQIDLKYIPDGMGIWLVSSFCPDSREVVVNGKVLYQVSSADARDLFLLPWCPERPVFEPVLNNNKMVQNIRRKWDRLYGFSDKASARTSLKILEDVMLRQKEGGDDFIRMFVVYIVSTFLSPVANGTCDFKILRCTVETSAIAKYDWCGYVLSRLCLATERFLNDVTQQSFSGCYLLLILSFLHRTQPPQLPRSLTLPFVGKWTVEIIEEAIKHCVAARWFGSGPTNNLENRITRDDGNSSGLAETDRSNASKVPDSGNVDKVPENIPETEDGGISGETIIHTTTLTSETPTQLIHTSENAEQLEAKDFTENTEFCSSVRKLMDGSGNSSLQPTSGLLETQKSCQTNASKNCTSQSNHEMGKDRDVEIQEILVPEAGRQHEQHKEGNQERTHAHEYTPIPFLDGSFEDESLDTILASIDGYSGKEEEAQHRGTSPWSTWPINQPNTHKSKLVRRLIAMNHSPLPRHMLEITDYCIAPVLKETRQPMPYNDGVLSFNMKDLKGFDRSMQPNLILLTAWSRNLNREKADTFPSAHICLDPYIWDGEIESMLDQWNTSLKNCCRSISAAELVFIPVCFNTHYTLLLLNFRTECLQFLDSRVHNNKKIWELAAKAIRKSLSVFLLARGHPSAASVKNFKVRFIGGEWRLGSRRADAGIYVMHLMKCYSGDRESLLKTPINKKYDLNALRVSFCCNLLLSRANMCKANLLDIVPLNISKKLYLHYKAVA